jgi:hypothetical protein
MLAAGRRRVSNLRPERITAFDAFFVNQPNVRTKGQFDLHLPSFGCGRLTRS